MMDMGCYTMNCLRYLTSSDPISVISATPILATSTGQSASNLVDRGMSASLALPNSVTATLATDLGVPYKWVPAMPEIRAVVHCEGGEMEMYNYVMPVLYHWIKVSTRDGTGTGRKVEYIKEYHFTEGDLKGEDWWTTYRYMLEAFVDKLKGRTPQTWITPEDSITNMKWIEEVYAKSNLGSRPASIFQLPSESE